MAQGRSRERIVVSGASALNYWRMTRGARMVAGDTAPVDSSRAMSRASTRVEHLRRLGLPLPIDVIVDERSKRRPSTYMRPHLWTHHLPPRCVEAVSSRVSVCTPEAALAQLARPLDVIDLLLLSLELAGTYVLSPGDPIGFCCTQSPLMSLDSLAFVRDWMAEEHVAGSSKLCQVDELLVPGSNSPMESKIAAFFLLPRRLGGFGLEGLHLNHRISLSQAARAVLGRHTMRPDLYYPDAKIAIEYNSRFAHPESTRSTDARRADALTIMGITTFSLDDNRVRNLRELTTMAAAVAEGLGIRRAPPSEAAWARRRELHGRLFLLPREG